MTDHYRDVYKKGAGNGRSARARVGETKFHRFGIQTLKKNMMTDQVRARHAVLDVISE